MQRAMEERKCFVYGGFGHITYKCREEGPAQVPSNKFEVLKSGVMHRGEGSKDEVRKDRKEILREEKAKRRVEVRQMKVERRKRRNC